MNHIEAFTCAKNPAAPETNEDRIAAIPGRLLAVVDGATDIGGHRYDDRLGRSATGGRLASEAVAEALAIAAAGSFTELPDPIELVGRLNAAIAAVYSRLNLSEEDVASGRHRFRAAFSAALIAGPAIRLVALGDCTIRINGKEVLGHSFPGDTVLSKARSVAWGILAGRGLEADTIRPLARQVIVTGPASGALPQPFRAEDAETICDAVRSDPAVRAACGDDLALIDRLLRVGLEGVRQSPETFDAVSLDGHGDPSSATRWTDLDLADVETLELASDGYPVLPETTGIAAWEAALARADATDPDRIDTHLSTKGRTATTFGDDRSILIANRTFSP
ncbi:hypothetical protein [Frigidibacter sp. ROC022]|uniref:hypothetical protein n=1 Tax=Frigidibacter sp. ROC022 TaxID=2971796 RepID=UPI00215A30EC|nr:hypothetical protein [Frigidibacter sp. ROC022]MCR8725095.1 hypothetical protein [Frigidibacter sp. ROC022]